MSDLSQGESSLDLFVMDVQCDPSLVARPGDFGAATRVDGVYVPVAVIYAFGALRIKPTTAGFLAPLHWRTVEFARAIGWTIEQVIEARERLITQLRGRVSDEMLDPGYLPGGGLPPEQDASVEQEGRQTPVAVDVGMALTEVRPFVRIAEDASLQARPGDFGARLEERTLHLAPATVAALVSHEVRDAEGILSFIHAFPTAVGVAMGWHIEDVIRARDALCSLLRGVVPANYTDPPPPPQLAMGAMAPDWVIQQTQAAAEQTPKTAYWIAVKSEARDQARGWVARLRKIPGLTVEEGVNPSRVRVLADATAIAIARVHVGSFCHIEEEVSRTV